MVRKRMHIEANPDPEVSFEPRLGADLTPIKKTIPNITTEVHEMLFKTELQDELNNACGNLACLGRVSLASTYHPALNEQRIIQTATINCASERCPLIDPGESGDREPRNPVPRPPSMSVELPIER